MAAGLNNEDYEVPQGEVSPPLHDSRHRIVPDLGELRRRRPQQDEEEAVVIEPVPTTPPDESRGIPILTWQSDEGLLQAGRVASIVDLKRAPAHSWMNKTSLIYFDSQDQTFDFYEIENQDQLVTKGYYQRRNGHRLVAYTVDSETNDVIMVEMERPLNLYRLTGNVVNGYNFTTLGENIVHVISRHEVILATGERGRMVILCFNRRLWYLNGYDPTQAFGPDYATIVFLLDREFHNARTLEFTHSCRFLIALTPEGVIYCYDFLKNVKRRVSGRSYCAFLTTSHTSDVIYYVSYYADTDSSKLCRYDPHHPNLGRSFIAEDKSAPIAGLCLSPDDNCLISMTVLDRSIILHLYDTRKNNPEQIFQSQHLVARLSEVIPDYLAQQSEFNPKAYKKPRLSTIHCCSWQPTLGRCYILFGDVFNNDMRLLLTRFVSLPIVVGRQTVDVDVEDNATTTAAGEGGAAAAVPVAPDPIRLAVELISGHDPDQDNFQDQDVAQDLIDPVALVGIIEAVNRLRERDFHVP